MVDSAIHAVHDYLPDASLHFLELIKGDNPDSFTSSNESVVLILFIKCLIEKGAHNGVIL